MATSGSVGGTNTNGGLAWSNAAAPSEFEPTQVMSLVSIFNANGAAPGCPQAHPIARSRMLTQWAAAHLLANGLDPDDMERVVISNAELAYSVQSGHSSALNIKVAGYSKRTTVQNDTWNALVAAGADGDADPFVYLCPANLSNQELIVDDADATTSKTLSALLQEQLRADGLISLVHYYENDAGIGGAVMSVNGGSGPTSPWPTVGVTLKFDWALEATGPELTLSSAQIVYRGGSGPAQMDSGLTVASEVDIAQAEIELQASVEGDVIAAGALPAGLSASFVGAVLTITGEAPAADYQTALRNLTFASTAAPSDTLRIVRFALTDVNDGSSGPVDLNVLVHSASVAEERVPQAACTNIRALAGFFAAAASRPVDIGGVMDSNAVQVIVSGHTQGLAYAWATALGCWGSGIGPAAAENSGWGWPVGDVFVGTAGGLGAAPTPASTPAAFQAGLWSPNADGYGIDSWDYFKPGSPGGTIWHGNVNTNADQYVVRSRHPLFTGAGLIYQAWVYVPETDPCQYIYPRLLVDIDGGASAAIYPAQPTPISLPEASGFGLFEWHIPAGTTVDGGASVGDDGSAIRVLHTHWTGDAGDAIATGEYGLLFQTLIDASKDRGCRYSRLMSAPGQTTRASADHLISVSDEGIANVFRFMAAGQRTAARNPQLPPVCLVHIMGGINDVTDTAGGSTVYPRGGPAEDDLTNHGNTVQGFVNNTTAIINRLRDVWVDTCGFEESNLYFLLGGSQPRPDGASKTMLMTTMTAAIAAICADPEYAGKVAGIDAFKIRTPEQMVATFEASSYSAADEASNDTYVVQRNERDYQTLHNGGDPIPDYSHLTERGYLDFDARLVSTLMSAAYSAGIIGTGGGFVSRRSISAGS